MNIDPSSIKYMIKASIVAEGIVDKPDVVGAIFGQTEGLIGDELDLRDLQKSGKIGRIEADVNSKKGKSEGFIYIPSSLDKVETAILASALETIDRVGPCRAQIKVDLIEDVRITKKNRIIERAKELLSQMMANSKGESIDLTESVRQAVQVDEAITYGPERLTAGPNVESSDAIIIVEGRNDVLNLLKYGIKNAIAVGGTNVPDSIKRLSEEKKVTAFVDGDRGGELILRELFQVAEVDFVARAPRSHEVEELTEKQIIKALRNKIPADQFMELLGIEAKRGGGGQEDERAGHKKPSGVRNQGPQPPSLPKDDDWMDEGPRPKEKPSKGERKEEKGQKGTPEKTLDRGSDKGKGAPKKPELEESPKPAASRFTDEQMMLKGVFDEVQSKMKGRLLDKDGKMIKEVEVKVLADTLRKESKSVHSVVFGGIITQRLLDIALDKGIKNVVGAKLGNVTKQPTKVKVYTKNDFE